MRVASLLLCVAAVAAFAPSSNAAKRTQPLRAIDAKPLFEAQAANMAKIQAALPLEPKDYPASLGLDTFTTSDGGAGSMASYEAPGPANIAWVSDMKIEGPTSVASLTVWCAPLKDVPHLVCRTTATDAGVDVFIDFRPRAAVGYDTALPDGSFPEPDSREAFMAKGERADLEKRFFGGLRELAAGAGGEPAPARGLPELETNVAGPCIIDARLPADAASVARATELCTAAVDAWLPWTGDDTHDLKPGMQVTSTYARDTKLRSNNYGILMDYYSSLFGAEDGANIAAGDAGPLDEAYVGGAS